MSVSQPCLESLFDCSGVAKTNPLLDKDEDEDEDEDEDANADEHIS